MEANALQRRFEFASRLIDEAGELAFGYFNRLSSLTIKSKGAQDMASEADLNTEVLIRDRLKEAFPEDSSSARRPGAERSTHRASGLLTRSMGRSPSSAA